MQAASPAGAFADTDPPLWERPGAAVRGVSGEGWLSEVAATGRGSARQESALPKHPFRAGREGDEPGNGPSSIRLATEYVHALFRRPIPDAVHFRRKGPGQPDDRDITHHNDVVDVRLVVVERDVC